MPSRLLRRSGTAVITFAHLLKWKPDAVFQVGIGLYHQEVNVMQEAWPSVRFIGCEPHPKIAASLRKNYPGELHQCAIGERQGEATLYEKAKHKDGSGLFPHKWREQTSLKVQMTTLDLLFPQPHSYGERLLLWLDCEGGELGALRGGERFVEHVGVINVEMTSNPPCEGWCDMMDVHHWLKARGFRRQYTHSKRSGAGQCDALYCRSELFQAKYCCEVSEFE